MLKTERKVMKVAITNIKSNPGQPRKYFDETSLKELAENIKQYGLLQPILVRPKDQGFEIIHGERRFKACQLADFKEIEAEIRNVADGEAFVLSLVENIQRKDISPIEEAFVYQKLLAGMSQKSLAERINKTQSYIAQKLRLLTLPKTVQYLLETGKLSEGQARQLLRLRNIVGRFFNHDYCSLFVDPEEIRRNAKEKNGICDWITYLQDEFAWRYYADPVSTMKEKVDVLYFNIIIAAIIVGPKEEQTIVSGREKAKWLHSRQAFAELFETDKAKLTAEDMKFKTDYAEKNNLYVT